LVLQAGVVAVWVKALLNVPVLAGVVPLFSLNFNTISGESPEDAPPTLTVQLFAIDELLTEVAVMIAVPPDNFLRLHTQFSHAGKIKKH
jgi:hypothetical protein